jgi:beta-glucosidase/6-phospho-beta-glucosidase/beta-galactosidase
MRFGLAHVDYKTKERRPRPSALIYKTVSEEKKIPDDLMHLAEPIVLDTRMTL